MTHRIGVDVGGTKIAAVVLNEAGNMVFSTRIDTPRHYDGVVAAIPAIVAAYRPAAGPDTKVGIGLPGSASPRSGLWRNCNLTFMNGRPVAADIAQAVKAPVRTDNDANCFALSEAIGGAGDGFGVVYALTLGTGLGGGLVIDGRVRHGPSGVGGEPGHVPLLVEDAGGPPPLCYCGRHGCAELYLSGSGLARDHARITGEKKSAIDIVAAARAGDDASLATLERYTDRLAHLVGILTNILDPDVVVLGGGLAEVPEIVVAAAAKADAHVFGGEGAPPIRTATSRESGARGAALLWAGSG